MKTSMKAKVVVETEKWGLLGASGNKEELTMRKIQEAVDTGHYSLEWINSELDINGEPTLILKI